jgi:hypothetical protein
MVYVACAELADGIHPVARVQMSTDGGQTFPTVFTVPFESAIPALAVAQNGTVGLLDTALFNNDLLTQFWELSANLQPLQLTAGSGNLTLSDFTDGLRYARDPYIGDYEGLVSCLRNI